MSYANEFLIKEDTLSELADTIRRKTGNSELMSPDEMITSIRTMALNGQEGDISLLLLLKCTARKVMAPRMIQLQYRRHWTLLHSYTFQMEPT